MAVTRQKNRTDETDTHKWPFGPKNYMLFGLALVDIILGFILLDGGDITWAPILLVLGFVVLVPLAIIVDGLPGKTADETADQVE